MALIKCSECNADISDKATTCPHCGCPVNVPKVTPLQQPNNINVNSNNVEKNTKSNILAGIMVLFFFPLGGLGIFISLVGLIWAIIELTDKRIKKKGWAVASLIVFIFTLLFGIASVNTKSNNSYYNETINVTSNMIASSSAEKNTKKITKENYDLIKEGMTEEEVFNILGEPQSQSENEIQGIGKTVLKHYQDFLSFVAIDVYFNDGKVYMKNWTEL